MLGRLRKARQVMAEAEDEHTSVPGRPTRSLARDLVLVMTDPDSGKVGSTYFDLVVAGALLVELAREGRLDVSESGKRTRVAVRDATPLGDEDLDDALLALTSGVLGTKVTRLINVLPPATPQVLDRLVAAGLLTEESHRALGMVPVRRHRPTPAAGRDALVGRVRGALLGESLPDERTALVVALLGAGGNLRTFVPRKSLGDAIRRSEEALDRVGASERTLVSAVSDAVTRAHSKS